MQRFWGVVAVLLAFVAGAKADQVPGAVIDHQPAPTKEYIGSPSILIAPNGNYIASHDLFGPGSTENESAESKIFVSEDRGKTWKQTATLSDQFWSNLFTDGKLIYLMGTTAQYGHIVIRTSADNGQSWSEAHYLTSDTGYHTAPVPVVVTKGKIYRAFEHHPTGPWGFFQAFVMWANVGSDLTKPSSWSFSNRVSFPADAEGNTWLEGNAVIAPDGSVLDVLRVDNLQRAAMLKLTGTTLALDRFVDFPGGATKFTIRFDPVSKLYWALSNPALPGYALSVGSPSGVRNTLVISSSPDLVRWTPRSIVLHHPDSSFHAFQYVDWQFDGSDIVVASRTAFDDDTGGANSFHNANYLTFHRIHAFRKLGVASLKGSPFTAAEVDSPSQIARWSSLTQSKAAMRDDGIYSQPVGLYGNHTTTITTRTKTGEAEEHKQWSDIFVVLSGEASLVSGGHLAGARTVAPGEMRGSSVVDGTTQQLKAGSVVHIDPNIPHQLILASGASFTYFVVKVKQPLRQ